MVMSSRGVAQERGAREWNQDKPGLTLASCLLVLAIPASFSVELGGGGGAQSIPAATGEPVWAPACS